MKSRGTLLAIFFCLMSACGYVSGRSDSRESDGPVALGEVLDFESVQSTIFAPRCVSCHSQYADYASVRREIDAIRSAVSSGRMPKAGGPLSAAQRELLESWIAGGARERADVPNAPTETPPSEPVWGSVSQRIFVPKCQVCHNPQGQAKFLDLSSRQAIEAARDRDFGGSKLLDVANPDQSYLLAVVEDPDEPMPPSWSNIPRLDRNEVGVLKEWIRRGLP